jgi:MoaA/NifB/PqqE/SkfB family radical SAM enzyme
MTSTPENFFCQAPFTNIQTAGDSNRPCCEINFSVPSSQDYFKDSHLAKIKEKLFNGIPPSECEKCIRTEKNSGQSLRKIINDSFPERSKEITNPDYFDIKDIFLVTSNTCNLKCLPCTGASFIRDRELYEMGLSNKIPITVKNNTDYKIFSSNKIETVTLSGGEPFYDKETFKILEFLVENNKSKNITLDINTNLTKIEESLLIWLRDNFKHVIIKASIDGVGEVNEYLRYPLTWEKVEESIEKIQKFPEIGLLVTTALSNLSLMRYYELIDWCLEKNIADMFITPVDNTEELYYINLPDNVKKNLTTKLIERKKLSSLNDSYKRCINFALESIKNSNTFEPSKIKKFLNIHDAHRNTNYKNVFPEIAWIENIK